MLGLGSVLEVLDEALVVEISPVVDLQFLVEWLDLLLELILGSGVHELILGVADVGGVQNK